MLVLTYFLVSIPIVSLSVYLCRGKRLVLYSNAFFVTTAYIHGLLIKPACVALGIPSPDLVQQVIDPVSIERYWIGSIVLAPLYLLFLVSTLPLSRSYRNRLVNRPVKRRPEVFSVVGLSVVLFVALAGAIGFLVQFPQFLTTLRKTSIASYELRDYDSGGGWRLLVSLSLIVSLFSIYNIGKRYKRAANMALLIASGAIYLSYVIISDQRANVLSAGLLWLVAYHVFVRHLTGKVIVTIILAFIGVGVAQTVYRMMGPFESAVETFQSALTNIMGRNGIEHSKTIHVIDSVPEKLEYMYGGSLVDAVAIVVPRALYPEKTTVNLDTQVGRAVFGNMAYGAGAVAPGLIAEMFLNFHVFGVLVGIVLMGRLSGLFDRWFDRGKGGLFPQFFYLLSFFGFGASVLGSGLSSTITALIMQGAALFSCFWLCRTIDSVGQRKLPRKRLALFNIAPSAATLKSNSAEG